MGRWVVVSYVVSEEGELKAGSERVVGCEIFFEQRISLV
jgi:hypothetical protein